MSDMTNEQIVAEFEELFSDGKEPEEEAPETTEETTEETADEEHPEETTEETEEQADDSGQEETGNDEPALKDTKQSRQNHAFAEQRLQIKKQNDFIKNIGKLIGFDEKASLEEIQEKVKDVLLEKEAKENNISVDLMKRLERAESLLQENDQIKLEKKVTEAFTDLIDEYDLSKEDVDDFTEYLINNGKNPMLDSNVDMKAEYLKLHYKDMVQAAVNAALEKENSRKKKVDEQASSGVGSSPNDKEEAKITSVKDLDAVFDSMDL